LLHLYIIVNKTLLIKLFIVYLRIDKGVNIGKWFKWQR